MMVSRKNEHDDTTAAMGPTCITCPMHEESDEEEEECRICRCPAEDGRPLVKPCKCSGSIALCHQDCLKSWLEVTRSTKCELCSTPFQFAPQYADGAPARLPPHEFLIGVLCRAAGKWLPFALRSFTALILWTCVLPLATAHLYYGWIHRPSSVVSRWKSELLVGDAVSGGVVAAFIIFSFLSLMSFADFLRFQWQQGGPNPLEPENNVVPGGAVVNLDEEDEENDEHIFPHEEGGVNNNNINNEQRQNFQRHLNNINEVRVAVENDDEEEDFFRPVEARRRMPRMMDRVEPVVQEEQRNRNADLPRQPQRMPANENNNNGAAAGDQENGMDIHIALDEILGLRGPLFGLIRNLLWLLAFNTVYLGIFACLPYAIGSRVGKLMLRVDAKGGILMDILSIEYNGHSIRELVSILNAENIKRDTILQLQDVSLIVLGYASVGATIYCLHCISSGITYLKQRSSHREQVRRNEMGMHMGLNIPEFDVPQNNESASKKVLACAAGGIKVTFLLSLKMLILPLSLGVWLDVTTLPLFDATIQDRIIFTGSDLFGSFLIHWVCGITFMMITTISFLQLREVVHPELLSKILRPEEPQPDVLAKLLKETGAVHARRLALSLTLYLVLSIIYFYIPTQILATTGITGYLPVSAPKICFLLCPQLQLPIEIILFHLSMLTVLEKFKNNIGHLQHNFFRFMCQKMGLTDYILPQSVSKFVLVGEKLIYTKALVDAPSDNNEYKYKKKTSIQIDSFWKELVDMSEPSNSYILDNLTRIADAPVYEEGITKGDGQRVLGHQAHIRIASQRHSKNVVKVPTAVGSFRFRLRCKQNKQRNSDSTTELPTIEVWKEVYGDVIARPPCELGVGGAEVEKRWSWGDETPSDLEMGIAKRAYFTRCANPASLLMKLFVLIGFFWIQGLLLGCLALNVPLLLGRCMLDVLHLPERWLHDPSAFVVGSLTLYPLMNFLGSNVVRNGVSSLTERVTTWFTSFYLPRSKEKVKTICITLALFLGIIPFSVGTFYELCVGITGNSWSEFKTLFAGLSVTRTWIPGAILFYGWFAMAYIGAFSRTFWTGLARGAAAAAAPNNENANAQEAEEAQIEDKPEDSWQGKEGRIGQFLDVITQVMSQWEWEKVDPQVLLKETLYPVFLNVLMSNVIPVILLCIFIVVQKILFGATPDGGLFIPILGIVSDGAFRMWIFRFWSAVIISAQLGLLYKAPLEKWYKAAHDAARDERYLIGEVLLDYQAK